MAARRAASATSRSSTRDRSHDARRSEGARRSRAGAQQERRSDARQHHQHLERQYALRRREHHDVRRHHRRRRRGHRDDRPPSRFCIDQRARRREPATHGRSRRSARAPVAGRSRADARARAAEPRCRERVHRRHGEPDAGRARRRGAPRRSTARAAARFSRRDFSTCTPIAVAVATSNGLFAFHRTTDADLSMTARTPDGTGSGWASAGSRDWGKIDPAAIGRAAARKAESSRNPQADRRAADDRCARTAGGERSRPAAVGLAERARRPTKGAARFRRPAAERESARRSWTSV